MLNRTIFILEPEDTRHRGGLFKFKRDDPDDDTVYVCNGDSATVKKLVNSILDRLLVIDRANDPWLLELIYDYREACVNNARGDWHENEAGESL